MEATKILLEAIATRKCVRALYNRTVMKLAPHILYTKHGELYMDAVAFERNGAQPRELKVGSFKLAGLNELVLLAETFAPQAIFNADDAKYEGVTLFAVDATAAS